MTGTGRVEVQAHDATFNLARLGGERVPVLIASDSVTWDGVRELHQVFNFRVPGSNDVLPLFYRREPE